MVVVAFNGAAVGDGDRYVRSIDARNEIGASKMDDRGDELRAQFERRTPTAEIALHAVLASVRQCVVDVPVTYALAGRPTATRPELVF